MAHVAFPPYGTFIHYYLDRIDPLGLAPPAWMTDEDDTEKREEAWALWREGTLGVIAKTLWPLWDQSLGSWINPDPQQMLALTNADLDLNEELQDMRMLAKKPVTTTTSKDIPTHMEYFTDEDNGKAAVRYGHYDTTLAAETLSQFATDFNTAVSRVGTTSLQCKLRIQRPRPYQTAWMLGRHRFGHERAITSTTASMSSGHALEGCMLTGGVLDTWLDRGFEPNRDQLYALAQFAVDIGDRRVFAGVHYPSDNMASWLIVLRLLPQVYRHGELKGFMVGAIREHSHVYRLIARRNLAAHQPALAALKTEMDALTGQ